MLKLVVLAVVIGCAIAHPGLFDGVGNALNTLTGSAGHLITHTTSGVGKAVSGIFGYGGEVMHVSVEQLQNYFQNFLGIQRVGGDYCTCPYNIIGGPYYQAGINVQTAGGIH